MVGKEWPGVFCLWEGYNAPFRNRPHITIGKDEMERWAGQARRDALRSGKSTFEARKAYGETCTKLIQERDMEPTLPQDLGITYKEWMRGLGWVLTDLNCTYCQDCD